MSLGMHMEAPGLLLLNLPSDPHADNACRTPARSVRICLACPERATNKLSPQKTDDVQLNIF
jgi:hypothetical protein